MGSVLTYVADNALRRIEGGVCHLCEFRQEAVYPYYGEIIDPELARNPELARQEPEVSELCAGCINGGNVKRTDAWTVSEVVSRFSSEPARAWLGFNKLPNIPLFIQGVFDWPMCCGDWCEFVGSPSSLVELQAAQRSRQYWAKGPSAEPRDFVKDGPPESFQEVSMFACKHCASGYYTDQFT